MSNIRTAKLTQIRENPVALRALNREAPEYAGLVQSMKNIGFQGCITVREAKDEQSGEIFFEILDGLHRYNAAKDAGLTEIPVDIKDLDQATAMEAQIMMNVHRVETKPHEYAAQLRRIVQMKPTMTLTDLATRLGHATQWLQDRLQIARISNPEIAALINEGKIVLCNAIALSKLPEAEQGEFVARAMTEAGPVFVEAVGQRIKEIREARAKGGEAAPTEFTPVAHLQKLGDIKALREDAASIQKLLDYNGVTSAADAAKCVLNWVLNLDKASVEAQKARDEQRKADAEAAKKRREVEKATKAAEKLDAKAKEAAEAAAKVKAQLVG
jgi:ParB/RepB/Spo0J family partition protein